MDDGQLEIISVIRCSLLSGEMRLRARNPNALNKEPRINVDDTNGLDTPADARPTAESDMEGKPVEGSNRPIILREIAVNFMKFALSFNPAVANDFGIISHVQRIARQALSAPPFLLVGLCLVLPTRADRRPVHR